jgi:formylglycine-generating enzyme required for sulfatase activity
VTTKVRLPGPLGKRYGDAEFLGKGAMGAVLRCRDRKLDRWVAIKLIRGVSDDHRRERFQREAQALSRIHHPHVLRLYDYGVLQEGPYMVLELLEGSSLEPGGEAPLETLLPVAEALDAVHAAGLLHRDVKPANIVRTPEGRVVLVDFGLALDDDATRITRTGHLVGTPNYLGPELFRGELWSEVGDWYSWGATLFAMFEGRPPFTMEQVTAWASGTVSLVPRFQETPVGGPRELLERCLSTDPARRPKSSAEVREILAPGDTVEETVELSRPAALPAKSVGTTEPTPPLGRSGFGRPLAWSAALFLLGLGLWWESPADAPPPGGVAAPKEIAAPDAGEVASEPPRLGPPFGLEERTAEGQAPRRFVNTRDGSEVVWLPGARILSRTHRGALQPGPARLVDVGPFLLSAREVTGAQYLRFVAETGHREPRFRDRFEEEPDWPVLGVTASDAAAYARWAGGRLPTLHEWQRAAGGAEGRTYPWGEASPSPKLARYTQGTLALLPPLAPVAVGSFPAGASPEGILDLAGNAEEWCMARADDLAGVDLQDLGGDSEALVPVGVGGAWIYDDTLMRTWSFRNWDPEARESSNGIRVAYSLVEPAP